MKKIRLTLITEDVQDGDPGSSTHCAIALALKRRFPGRLVSVGIEKCSLGNPYTRYLISKKGQDFINQNIQSKYPVLGLEKPEPVIVILTPLES